MGRLDQALTPKCKTELEFNLNLKTDPKKPENLFDTNAKLRSILFPSESLLSGLQLFKIKLFNMKRNRSEFDCETNCLNRILKYVNIGDCK